MLLIHSFQWTLGHLREVFIEKPLRVHAPLTAAYELLTKHEDSEDPNSIRNSPAHGSDARCSQDLGSESFDLSRPLSFFASLAESGVLLCNESSGSALPRTFVG